MSITARPSAPEKIYKKSLHRCVNDSNDLDMLSTSRYFSGCNEASCRNCRTYIDAQKIMREEREPWRAGRMSFDVPVRDLLPQHSHRIEKTKREKKKHKQPSSPGKRLASFLNSLFKQAALKKKKSKSATQSMKDEEESPGGRRWRRSSVSHFRSSIVGDSRRSIDSPAAIYSSSSSGFRTPPPYTPTKGYNFGSCLDGKKAVSFSKYGRCVNSTLFQNDVLDDTTRTDLAWLDEKLRINSGFSEKCNVSSKKNMEKDIEWVKKYSSVEKEIKKFDELDDGADTDSSSDLFELQNYDLGYYASDLPVYETTHLDSIKKGNRISS